MDREEFEYRVEQIQKLYAKKDFKTIASIADKIEWKKVKSASLSSVVSEAYDRMGEYEKAKEVLLIAYNRGPVTRQLLYRLTIAAVRGENIPSAIDFFKEYVKLSPNDANQYILKYEIARVSNVALKDQIKILEAYNSLELDEQWQYELAKLYSEAGMEKKCVDLCDEVILWFSEGEFVEKAQALKDRYVPREAVVETPIVEEAAVEMTETTAEEPMEEVAGVPVEEPVEEMAGMLVEEPVEEMAGIPVEEPVEEMVEMPVEEFAEGQVEPQDELPVEEPVVDDVAEEMNHDEAEELVSDEIDQDMLSAIDAALNAATVAEIAENVAEAQEEVTPEDVVEETKSLVTEAIAEEPELNPEDVAEESEELSSEAVVEEPEELSSEAVVEEPEEISESVEETLIKEASETGEDTLKEDITPETIVEETSAEEPPVEASQEYLEKMAASFEERKEDFCEDANKFFDEAATYEDLAINELEKYLYSEDDEGQMSFRIEELLQNDEQIEGQMSISDLFDIYEDRLEQKNIEAEEAAKKAAERLLLVRGAREEAMKRLEEQKLRDVAQREANREEAKEETDLILEAVLAESVTKEMEKIVNEAKAGDEEENIETKEAELEENLEAQEENSEESALDVELEAEENAAAEASENDEEKELVAKENEPLKAENIDEETSEEAKLEEKSENKIVFEKPLIYNLNEEQKELFGEHLLNKKMESRICDTIAKLVRRNEDGNKLTGTNLVVAGDAKSGKTTLAINIIKIANRESERKGRKIAKAGASVINNKNIPEMFEKLQNADLIIENAGKLSGAKVEEIAKAINESDGERLVVLEDSAVVIEKLFRDHPVLKTMFRINLTVEELNVKQWAQYAREYAKHCGYAIDEMGFLALHVRIGELNKGEEKVTSDDVKDVIDDAIDNAKRKGIGKLFGAFSHKEKESGGKLLREQDFI